MTREVTFLSKISAFPELKTKKGYGKIIHYIQTKQMPANLTARQQRNFLAKYDEKGFEVKDGTLYYRLAEEDLEIVFPSKTKRTEKVKSIYDDAKTGLGTGLEQFYQQVAKKYLNITKKFTDHFLQKQGDYIVTRVPINKTHLVIKTSAPQARWSVDLVDMTMYDPMVQNRNYKYIFTCVDYFSGKVWARAIKNRENAGANLKKVGKVGQKQPENTFADALKSIMEESHSKPQILQVDNEFDKGGIKLFCQQNDIKIIAVLSYQSFTNGKVERMNRELRKKTKAGFVRHNNLNWVDHLQDYVENINNQKNARTKRTPNEMWSEGYHKTQADRKEANVPMVKRKIQAKQRKFLQERYKKTAERNERYTFEEGDEVRIKLLAIATQMREKKKHNIGWNQVAVHYTPEIYVVEKVETHRDTASPTRYLIRNRDDKSLVRDDKDDRVRHFKGSDLILVKKRSTPVSLKPPTTRTAFKLNRITIPGIAKRGDKFS